MRICAAIAACAAFLLIAPAQAAETEVGDLVVINAWTGPAPTGAAAVPVFMTIISGAEEDDVLVGAATDKAEESELRHCVNEFGVMRSVPVDEIEIPAGETVELEPCGYHVMMVTLKEPLVVGEEFPLTLEFETAGEAAIPVSVLDVEVGVCTCAAEPEGEGEEYEPEPGPVEPGPVEPPPEPHGSY